MRRRWSTLPEQQSPTACRRCATVPSRTGAPISIPQRMAPGGWKHQPRSSPPPACACGSGVLHQGPAAGPMVPGLRNPAVQGSSRAGRRAQVAENVKAPADHDRDGSSALSLSNVRDALIKLEDTIIFTLVERSQFKSNHLAYQSGGIPVPGFCGEGRRYSFLEWLLFETEQTHAKIRRYTSPDELAFFPDDLPPLVLPPLQFPQVLAPYSKDINYNPKIMNIYLKEVIPAISEPGDDKNYGSSCLLDVTLLQALSKRIHYGKFVAEAKFVAQTEEYTQLILAKDVDGIMALLTDLPQEERVIARVEHKASVFGQDMSGTAESPAHKVDPKVVGSFYRDWLMPMTKDVEVDYLLRRLEWDRR